MVNFYFNDCIPKDANEAVLVSKLDLTFREYLYLQNKNRSQIDGVITPTVMHEVFLTSDPITLHTCLQQLKQDIKATAFRIFNKYPLKTYFPEGNDSEILENDYKVIINSIEYSAINPAITYLNSGCLFTLNLHADLANDYLDLLSNSGDKNKLLNLYGDRLNSDFIDAFIKECLVASGDNFEKLKTLTAGVFSDKAIKQFRGISLIMQNVIIGHFKDAISTSGGRNLKADKTLVREVDETRCKHNVFELRVFSPVAYRIYFACDNDRIFINSFEKKPAAKVQSTDIKAAKAGLETLFSENRS
jgi:hypothetical protein